MTYAKLLDRPVGVFSVALVAALLFLLLGPFSNFGSKGYLDPWFYTGYFTNFSYLLHHIGITYYVSRLPWIIPGLIVFSLTEPVSASIILNSLIMAFSATALYLIVFWHYGKPPAVLTCVALITNPYFMSAVSWDYPDGPAIAYALIAMACFLRPGGSKTTLGGAFLALSLYTNMAGLPVILAILLLPLWPRRQVGEMFSEGIRLLCAFLAMTVLLCLASKTLLGQYLFFKPQIDQIRYVMSHPEYLSNMWGTGNQWMLTAYRLFPAVFGIIVGSAMLTQKPKRPSVFLRGYAVLLFTLLFFSVFEFEFHNTGLRVAYQSSYMIASLFAFMGMVLGEIWLLRSSKLREPDGAQRMQGAMHGRGVIWAGLAVGAIALPFWYAAARPLLITPMRIWIDMAAIGACTVVCLILTRKIVSAFRYLVCGLLLVDLFLGPALDPSLGYPWSKENVSVFRTLMALESSVKAALPSERSVECWVDSKEPARYLFDSACSVFVWGYFDFSNQIPQASAETLRSYIRPNTTFLHLTTKTGWFAEQLAERRALLESRGITIGNLRQWTLPSGDGLVNVALEDVMRIDANMSSPASH